jgi:cysteine desulfurase
VIAFPPVYLDWAATAIPENNILQTSLSDALTNFGNPSSSHDIGRNALKALEESRAGILKSIGFKSGILALTGSGTEADQIPLLAILNRRGYAREKPRHIVISEIEHAAIYKQAEVLENLGIRVTRVAPGEDGRVSADKILGAVDKDTALVAVMAVNNETGAIQPIREIGDRLARIALQTGSPRFHVDAVQALGKVRFEWSELNISSAAFSAHKIGGPKGVGALWLDKPVDPLASGGGQEGGMRSGTENLFGVLSLWKCLLLSLRMEHERYETASILERALIEGIKSIPGASVVPEFRGPKDPRFSPFIVSLAFPGVGGEVMARALAGKGIAVSTGSACSSKHKDKTRRVLNSMGMKPELSSSTIRVSTGTTTEKIEIDRFLDTVASLYRILKN